jgi:hypothetical protein
MARGSFEDELLQALRFSGIESDNLQDLVRTVVEIQETGLEGVKVFPKGTVGPDSLQVKAVLSPQQLQAFINKFVIDMPRVRAVSIFPYGIIAPEAFGLEVEVG